ncbi:MAG: 16S rRNA (guanine(966)-N(2))-methyltransferase RsmD [Actinomycetes bacterium]
MTRVIAGAARGRRLSVPPGGRTRPTSDKAREALFSTVESMHGPLVGAHVLDLYAGSGAVGLEAASRGASHVLLVENDARAVRVLGENVDAVGLAGVRVARSPVERLVAVAPRAGDGPYDVVFADPPYTFSAKRLADVLVTLQAGGWLADGALVIVERATRDPGFAWPDGFVPERSKRYGEGTLWYGRAAVT